MANTVEEIVHFNFSVRYFNFNETNLLFLYKQLLQKCPDVRLGVDNFQYHPFFSCLQSSEPLAIACGPSAVNTTAENEVC